jgi:V/A-type H+/Na+-transporting ATPase subunit I
LQAERHGLAALGREAAEFVEQILRLLVNTVSFARIGAFALAHAGLSAAIVELAGASGTVGGWIVLAVGNILVIGLEGLVVGIQTTRLMLFEFFIRFLTGGGREFKPLPPPGSAHFPASSLRGQT